MKFNLEVYLTPETFSVHQIEGDPVEPKHVIMVVPDGAYCPREISFILPTGEYLKLAVGRYDRRS